MSFHKHPIAPSHNSRHRLPLSVTARCVLLDVSVTALLAGSTGRTRHAERSPAVATGAALARFGVT